MAQTIALGAPSLSLGAPERQAGPGSTTFSSVDSCSLTEKESSRDSLSTSLSSDKLDRLTEKDVEKELRSLSEEQKAARLRDLFPPPRDKREKCHNSDYAFQTKIRQMWQHIERIPLGERIALLDAAIMCPKELTNKRYRLFLIRDNMDPELAANRLVYYWKRRREVFGPDKWHLPMTQDGALRDECIALKVGFFRVVAGTDNAGRPLFLTEPGLHNREGYTTESMLRVLWYMMEAVVQEHGQAAAEGTVNMGCFKGRNPSTHFFDRKLLSAAMDLEAKALPFQIRAIHCCHQPEFFRHAVFPLVLFVLQKRMRIRFCAHGGSDADVLESLDRHGLSASVVPYELGGNAVLDHTGWLKKKRDLERKGRIFLQKRNSHAA